MSNKDYREQSLMFFQNFTVDTNTISLSRHEQVCLGGLRYVGCVRILNRQAKIFLGIYC